MALHKTSHIQLRLSPHEKAAIQSAARQAGMDMTEWILACVLPDYSRQFQEKMANLTSVHNPRDRKFALADLHDFLIKLDRVKLEQALSGSIELRLDSITANYVAAMIEMACHINHIQAPAWVCDIAPLEEPFFATDLLSLRPYLLRVSPPPFRSRNIFVDTSLGGRQ